MKTSIKTLSFLAGATLFSFSSLTAVETEPVGYVSINCLGGSDTFISLPMPASASLVASVDSVSLATSEITLSVDSMTVNEFQLSHYIRFGRDAVLEGATFQIQSNTSDSVVVTIPSGYALSDVTAGDPIAIVENETLGSLFSGSAVPNGTELFYFENSTNGVNKSSAGGYFFDGTNWLDTNDFSNADGAVLFPGETFVVRVPGGVAEDFSIIDTGSVPNVGHNVAVVTGGVGANDNFVSATIPAPVELLQLFPSPSNGDEVLIFDNTQRAQNKASSSGYFYDGSNWFDLSDFTVADNALVNPSEIPVYRRADQGGTSTTTFQGRAEYLNNL